MSAAPARATLAGGAAAVAADALAALVADPGLGAAVTPDGGPAVLAAAAARAGWVDRDLATAAALAWLDGHAAPPASVALCGGLAGLLCGARAAATLAPPFASLADQLADKLGAAGGAWRDEAPLWSDYDLITGPAGVIAALVGRAGAAGAMEAAALHLAHLCRSADLDGLRVGGYQDDALRAWNHGRINTGLAHGVGGVIAALRAALVAGVTAPGLEPALAHACAWLRGEAYLDARGLVTWSPGGREGAPPPRTASRRQSWCYGTPGLAWVLWDAAGALDDVALRGFAEDAMRSFCRAFDPRFHLDDGDGDDALAVCHGLAGTLATADAFAHHARLPEAIALAGALEAALHARLDAVAELARGNLSLLTGASGILAVLATRATGERTWLTALALR